MFLRSWIFRQVEDRFWCEIDTCTGMTKGKKNSHYIYTGPSESEPTGVTRTSCRRRALAGLLAKAGHWLGCIHARYTDGKPHRVVPPSSHRRCGSTDARSPSVVGSSRRLIVQERLVFVNRHTFAHLTLAGGMNCLGNLVVSRIRSTLVHLLLPGGCVRSAQVLANARHKLGSPC